MLTHTIDEEADDTIDDKGDDPAIRSVTHEPVSLVSAIIRFVLAHRGPSAVVAAATVVFVSLSINSIAAHAPLGHDESVYALRGSYYSGDSDDTRGYWAGYRAPGLPFLLGFLFRLTGPSDSLARLSVLAFGVVLVLAVFALGSMVASAWTGACAAVLTMATTAFARFSSLVYVDVAGIAVAALAVALGLWWWRGDRLARPAYIAVPLLAAAATMVRFGAPVAVAAGLTGVIVFKALRVDRVRLRRLAIESAGLGVLTGAASAFVLFVPAATGLTNTSPFKSQRAFRDAKGIPTWRSLEDLAPLLWPDNQPADFFHPVVFAAFAIGTAVAVVELIRRRSESRAGVLFGLIGTVLAIVALNFNLSHLEGQYLIAALPFAAVLAAIGICSLWNSVTSVGRPAFVGAAAIAFVAYGVSTVAFAGRLHEQTEDLEANYRVIADAGLALRAMDIGDCAVVTGTTPQAAWYTGCNAARFEPIEGDFTPADTSTLDEQIRLSVKTDPHGANAYILYPSGGKRQPVADGLETNPLLSLVLERGDSAGGRLQWVRVFAVVPCLYDDTCPDGTE